MSRIARFTKTIWYKILTIVLFPLIFLWMVACWIFADDEPTFRWMFKQYLSMIWETKP